MRPFSSEKQSSAFLLFTIYFCHGLTKRPQKQPFNGTQSQPSQMLTLPQHRVDSKLMYLDQIIFLFLRKLPCLFISASTSCILPTVGLQLRNSTKTIKPSFPKLSIPSILLPLFLAFVQFYSFLWQKTIFFTMSIFISGWMVHSSLTAC